MLIDNHTHTGYSPDSTALPEEMIEAAQQAGVGVYTITDHCDVDEFEKMLLEKNIPASIAHTKRLQEKARLKLLTGLELGQPLKAPKYAKWALSQKVDCIIGSVHSIEGFEDFYWADYLSMSDDEIYRMFQKYYADVLKTVKKFSFDTLAHITYPYRYLNAQRGKRDFLLNPRCFDPMADEIFARIAKSGRAIELNGASILRSELDRELNAHYLSMFQEAGGEFVTVGSDAHNPADVARGIRECYALLKAAGFSEVTYFENRKPKKVLI